MKYEEIDRSLKLAVKLTNYFYDRVSLMMRLDWVGVKILFEQILFEECSNFIAQGWSPRRGAKQTENYAWIIPYIRICDFICGLYL